MPRLHHWVDSFFELSSLDFGESYGYVWRQRAVNWHPDCSVRRVPKPLVIWFDFTFSFKTGWLTRHDVDAVTIFHIVVCRVPEPTVPEPTTAFWMFSNGLAGVGFHPLFSLAFTLVARFSLKSLSVNDSSPRWRHTSFKYSWVSLVLKIRHLSARIVSHLAAPLSHTSAARQPSDCP